MKKRFFLIVSLALIFSSSLVSAGLWDWLTGLAASDICTDSDNGKDYAVKGTTTKGSSSYSDCCSATKYGSTCIYEGPWLFEYICEEDTLKVTQYECPYGCQDGICVEESTIQNSCEDTDNGKNYYTQGTIIYCTSSGCEDLEDQCSGSTLTERYCSGYTPAYESYDCPYGCEEGGCLTTQPKCLDTDNGVNYYEKGIAVIEGMSAQYMDFCYGDNYLKEYYCGTDQLVWSYQEKCQYGCTDGACLKKPQEFCMDSDGGLDYYVLGYVTTNEIAYPSPDGCVANSNTLMEGYCDGKVYRIQPYGCPDGCKDGVCVRNTQEPEDYCIDSDNGKNYFVDGNVSFCYNGECDTFEDTCYNGYLDEYYCNSYGHESSVTYKCPNGCGVGACISDEDVIESCYDQVKNQDETDVDCGGSCPACANGKSCIINSDCVSSNCQSGICKAYVISSDIDLFISTANVRPPLTQAQLDAVCNNDNNRPDSGAQYRFVGRSMVDRQFSDYFKPRFNKQTIKIKKADGTIVEVKKGGATVNLNAYFRPFFSKGDTYFTERDNRYLENSVYLSVFGILENYGRTGTRESSLSDNPILCARLEHNPFTCTDYEGARDHYRNGSIYTQEDPTTNAGSYKNDECRGSLLIEKYCDSWGYLDSEEYECPKGCYGAACIKASSSQTCSDGTDYGSCSTTKPKYCDGGFLLNNCSLCGCPTGYQCQEDHSCASVPDMQNCSDGTIHDNCSISKPLFCENGVLVERCVVCGCPEGYECDQSQGCSQAYKFDMFMSIATLSDSYHKDQPVALTDPPDAASGTSQAEEGSSEGESGQEDQPQYKGYIIKFKDDAVVEAESGWAKQAEKNDKRIESMADYNPVKYAIQPFLLESDEVPKKVTQYKQDLIEKRIRLKDKIARELEKEGANKITGNAVSIDKAQGPLEQIREKFSMRINQITGYAVSEEDEIEVMNEYYNVFNGIALNISDQEAQALRGMKEIEEVYPNMIVEETLMDSVPMIKADEAWQMTDSDGDPITGKGITIGIIDTGVDYEHPDLGGCLGEGCKVIGGYDFVNEDHDPMDDYGHGTHCAAIAAGNGILKGVAPDAKIIAYKVLDNRGSGSFDDVIAAIDLSTDPNQDGDTSDHLDVISLSLGAKCKEFNQYCGPDDPVSQAIDNAYDSGVLAVVAAGNDGPEWYTIGTPGTARKAITVGAVDKEGNIARFSSRGHIELEDEIVIKPDIVAPGVGICAAQFDSAYPDYQCLDNQHIALDGTSMATPHVAGVAALVIQKHHDWSTSDVKDVIKNTADNLADDFGPEIHQYGMGVVDALAAVQQDTKMPTAKITTKGKVKGIIDIEGVASASDFAEYKLECGFDLNPFIWTLLISSTEQQDQVLLPELDTSLLKSGINLLKLTVTDRSGRTSVDYSFITVQNNYISFPTIFDPYHPKWFGKNFFGEGTIDVIGSADVDDFGHYELKVRDAYTYEDKITIQYDNPVDDDVLGTIDTSSLEKNSLYTLSLEVYDTNNRIVDSYSENVLIHPTLERGWPYSFADPCEVGICRIFFRPTISDVNHDGKDEVIITKENQVDVLDGNGNNLAGWPQTIISYNPVAVVCDINGDNNKEIIVSGRPFGYDFEPLYVYKFNSDGSQLPNSPMQIGIGSAKQLACSDINGDGKDNIIVTSPGILSRGYNQGMNIVRVFDENGNYLPGWPVSDSSWTNTDPGNPAVVVNKEYGKMIAVNIRTGESSYAYLFDYMGNVLPGWPKTTTSQAYIKAGDLDEDGNDDIIIFDDRTVHAYDYQGNYLPGFPVSTTIDYRDFVLADIDSDNKLEIFLVEYQKFLILNNDGSQYLYKEFALSHPGKPVIADVDNDGIPEVILMTDQGFKVYSKEGDLYEYSNMYLDSHSSDIIVIGNIDDDPNLEFIGSDITNHIYAWELPGYGKIEWSQYLGNEKHTNRYGPDISIIPPTPEPSPERPQSKLVNNGPTKVSGTLVISLLRKSDGQYQDYLWVVNQTVSLDPGELLKLDALFNPNKVVLSEEGEYRVKAEFKDQYGNQVSAKWDFEVIG